MNMMVTLLDFWYHESPFDEKTSLSSLMNLLWSVPAADVSQVIL